MYQSKLMVVHIIAGDLQTFCREIFPWLYDFIFLFKKRKFPFFVKKKEGSSQFLQKRLCFMIMNIFVLYTWHLVKYCVSLLYTMLLLYYSHSAVMYSRTSVIITLCGHKNTFLAKNRGFKFCAINRTSIFGGKVETTWIIYAVHSLKIGSISVLGNWYEPAGIERGALFVLSHRQHRQTPSFWILYLNR